MIASHIHDALAQVRKLQELIVEKRLFHGYSGKARIISGMAALAGALVMDSNVVPENAGAHLAGWGVVLGIGVIANYAGLFYWFLCNAEARRNPVMLKPAIDAVPALAVGAILTCALLTMEQYDLLFGTWMCMYGLAQVAYRQSLPRGIYAVGLCYVLAGTLCLVPSPVSFVNPWPMGIVFFLGEVVGGVVLMRNQTGKETT